MGVSASLPKLRVYLAPTSQSSWSKRPFHVSLSSSLWTDLLMVAILFRLNEFTLAHLVPGFQGFWQPVTVFFAVYDVWETRVLFDSVFMYQDDLFHHVLGIFQWLLLALMATTITPTLQWDRFDALLFAGFKLSHQSIRVFNYLETYCLSRSKRARKAAGVRSLVYLAGWPFTLAALVMIATGSNPLDVCSGMWVVGFFTQRIFWALLKWDPFPNSRFHFGRDAQAIKTNVPFKTTRYGDWTMLQLGAIILGFMTVPTTSLGSYGVLTFGYTYVAALNLLAYSMNPEDPEQHALVKGGMREFVWLELFSLGGLAFMGIAVGLRVHLFYPMLVVLPNNRHYTWILCISAMVTTMVMFAQEYSHGGQIARLNGGKIIWLKLFTACMFVVSAGAFVASDTKVVAFVILGLAVVSLAVLLVQVVNGAFRRQIVKTYRAKLMGHFRAAVWAIVLLSRARRRLKEIDGLSLNLEDREEETKPVNHASSIALLGGPNNSRAIKHTMSMPENIGEGNESDDSFTSPTGTMMTSESTVKNALTTDSFETPRNAIFTTIDKKLSFPELGTKTNRHSHVSGNGSTLGVDKKSSNISSTVAGYVASSVRSGQRRLSQDRRRLSVVVKHEIRMIKVVLNDKVYSPPHVFVEGNKATKYRVQWSDLFFDVLFVGVVFRLGDLLLAGIGATFSEESIHYEAALAGGYNNGSVAYVPPHDPARSDATFIFGSVFVAVWAMWHNKLAYSSKVGTNDVVHKVVDMLQGLFVLLCAVNITTPNLMENSSSGNAYAVAGSLLAFQLSMVGLWVELYFSDGKKDSRAKGTALRNIKRDTFTALPLMCSFATIATGASISITSFLWALSWLLPFLMRVAVVRFVNDQNAVRDLHRYVIHRLGDGALIVLGEGVLQIIRAETSTRTVYSYLNIALGLFLMTVVRIAVWSMDCFTDPSKHAQLLSLDAGLAAYFIRSVAAPALVGMGVALKKMINISTAGYNVTSNGYYWLLCGASAISLFTLIITYELHRFAFHRKWRTREFAIMVFISSTGLYWASIPAPAFVIVALSLFTWTLSVIVHYFLDDYFLLKEQVKNKTKMNESALKRVDSRMTNKTGRPRIIDLGKHCFMCLEELWESMPSCCIKRARNDDGNVYDDEMPMPKKIVPIQELEPVRINDPMLPAVGLLERQPSVIMTEHGQRELTADNPNFYEGETNRSPDASIRVPVNFEENA